MKKIISFIFAVDVTVLMLVTIFGHSVGDGLRSVGGDAPCVVHAAQTSQAAAMDIVKYLENSSFSGSLQALIDGFLSENAGMGAEWFAYSVNRLGEYDFSSYVSALEKYNSSAAVLNPSQREKHALILMSMGADNTYASNILDSSAFELGLMSRVFALHIVNNGFSTDITNTDSLINSIFALKKNDGGWAISGDVADVDCTAMVLQALAPLYGKRADVTETIDSALALLASRREQSGGFKSYGRENCESTAQVIIALASLGINPDTDSRFNDKSLISVLLSYRLADGSYSHELGGAYNGTATSQALGAFVSLSLLEKGEKYYVFNETATVPPVQTTASTEAVSTAAKPVTQASAEALSTAVSTAAAESTVQTSVAEPVSVNTATENTALPPADTKQTENLDNTASRSKRIIILVCTAGAFVLSGSLAVYFSRKKRG